MVLSTGFKLSYLGWRVNLEVKVVEVDLDRCRAVASRVRGFKLVYRRTLDRLNRVDREDLLRFLFFFMSICYDTRRVGGFVNGRYYRGSDYLYYAMLDRLREDRETFNPERIAGLTLEEFLGWFPSGRVSRASERVRLLRDTAARLLEVYGGSVSRLLEDSEWRVSGRGGLADRLSSFKAFSDPLAKKVMVFASIAEFEGVVSFKDSGFGVTVGVDYHLQRIALRTGMVKVADSKLRRKLERGFFVSRVEHDRLRAGCLDAYRLLTKESGLKPREVDHIFWQIGRSCCRPTGKPVCMGPCSYVELCTVREVGYRCRLACPLYGVCEAGFNPDLRKVKEPRYRTFYY